MVFLHMFTTGQWEPHGHCFNWVLSVLLPMVIGHALIAAAYAVIPAMLIRAYPDVKDYFQRARHLWRIVPWFAAFIFACGGSHAFNVWNIWHADYQASSVWLFITGVISWRTVWLLPAAWRDLRRLIESAEAERAQLRADVKLLEDRLAAYQDPLDDETKYLIGRLATMGGRVVH